MPNNAMMPNRAGQDAWLEGWQQRQKANNPTTYNASWMPKAGWRGRFNQSQQQPAWKTEPKAPVPGSYEHTGPREPVNTPGVPYAPPVPPVYSAPGWRTLAPVGVPEGGWGGGALEHTPGQLISGPTARETGVPGQSGQYGGINPVVGPNGERLYGGMGAPPPAPTPPPPGKMGMNYGQAPWGPRTNAMMEY